MKTNSNHLRWPLRNTRTGGPGNKNTRSLAGYWKLAENIGSDAYDSSGNGNTGIYSGTSTNTNTPPISFPGLYSRGFNGVSDSVDLGASSLLNFSTTSFSYMLWVYVLANTGAFDMVISHGGSSPTNPGYDMELGTGAWTFNLADGTTGKQGTLNNTPIMNQWVHLAVVVDRLANKASGYLNGLPFSSIDISGLGSLSGSAHLFLGRDTLTGRFWFNGLIGDVRIFNRSLSPYEIRYIATGNS